MAAAKERGPAPGLVVALGVGKPKGKPEAEPASGVPDDFAESAAEALGTDDPARISALYDAVRSGSGPRGGGGLMGGMG